MDNLDDVKGTTSGRPLKQTIWPLSMLSISDTEPYELLTFTTADMRNHRDPAPYVPSAACRVRHRTVGPHLSLFFWEQFVEIPGVMLVVVWWNYLRRYKTLPYKTWQPKKKGQFVRFEVLLMLVGISMTWETHSIGMWQTGLNDQDLYYPEDKNNTSIVMELESWLWALNSALFPDYIC